MVVFALRGLFLCVVLLFAALPHPADAQTRRSIATVKSENSAKPSAQNTQEFCKSTRTQSTVKLATAKTKIIRNQNANSLTALHGAAHGASVTLGLAGGPIEITMKGRFTVRTKGSASCVNLEQLDVLLWTKPVLFIASNFNKGSCEYREVLKHEQKHIRTLRDFVKKSAPELKREVKNILRTEETTIAVETGGEDNAQQQIETAFFRRLEAFQTQMIAALNTRQAKIDSPEEYARVHAQCRNWDRKLATSEE